MTPDETDE